MNSHLLHILHNPLTLCVLSTSHAFPCSLRCHRCCHTPANESERCMARISAWWDKTRVGKTGGMDRRRGDKQSHSHIVTTPLTVPAITFSSSLSKKSINCFCRLLPAFHLFPSPSFLLGENVETIVRRITCRAKRKERERHHNPPYISIGSMSRITEKQKGRKDTGVKGSKKKKQLPGSLFSSLPSSKWLCKRVMLTIAQKKDREAKQNVLTQVRVWATKRENK